MLRWEPPGALIAVHAEATLPGDPDQPWVGAGGRGRRQLVGAERSAADGAIDAGTLVFTAGTEALAVLLHSSPLWWSHGLTGPQSWFSWAAHTLQHPHPSGTALTPGGQTGGSSGQSHTAGQPAVTWRRTMGKEEREGRSGGERNSIYVVGTTWELLDADSGLSSSRQMEGAYFIGGCTATKRAECLKWDIYPLVSLKEAPPLSVLLAIQLAAKQPRHSKRAWLHREDSSLIATCPTRLRTRVMTQFKTGTRPRKLPVIALMLSVTHGCSGQPRATDSEPVFTVQPHRLQTVTAEPWTWCYSEHALVSHRHGLLIRPPPPPIPQPPTPNPQQSPRLTAADWRGQKKLSPARVAALPEDL
ncbi:hypothetical protein EYF80_029782 [Liparis tanakae]|uniref:Uncharacterized protein n=1 Tax=Liparis tanakae TaxID=230148 RepID=A0A4Z2H5B7_9TELE|nr:hypothetical protein EYF80_029782 [Liparis tanakae]